MAQNGKSRRGLWEYKLRGEMIRGVMAAAVSLNYDSQIYAGPIDIPSAGQSETFFVDASAAPGGDGSTWLLAFPDLEQAIALAEEAPGSVGEIHVADGVYRPSKRLNPLDPRSATFAIPPNVHLLGGFAGISAPLAERDPTVYTSSLDGDIAMNDTVNFGNRGDNVYHVVYALDVLDSVMDGFLIRGGFADGQNWPHDSGGGLLIMNMGLVVRNCTFSDNWAGAIDASNPPQIHGDGGAVARFIVDYFPDFQAAGGGAFFGEYLVGSFIECHFELNKASEGGAVFGSLYDGEVVFQDCGLRNNVAEESGGGINLHVHGDSTLTVVGGVFEGNFGESGGGMNVHNGEIILESVEFLGNTASFAGGGLIANGQGTVFLNGCTFKDNEAAFAGGALLYSPGIVSHCLFDGNSAEYTAGGLLTSQMGIASVQATVFNRNYAGEAGGGHYGGGPLQINECTYTSNTAGEGGGLFSRSPSLEILGCLFNGNYAPFGGAINDASCCGPS